MMADRKNISLEHKEDNRVTLFMWRVLLYGVAFILIIVGLLFALRIGDHPSPPYLRSFSNVKYLNIGVMSYQIDYDGAWPRELADLVPYFFDATDVEWFDNPREGFSGYHFERPETPLDEIENPSELAILFEVRDDGTIAYDTGVIGYADGHVEYIVEPDE